MAKFEVCATISVQRAIRFTVNIARKDVVDAMGLEGEDAKEWQEQAADYVSDHWDEIRAKVKDADIETQEETDEELVSVDSADSLD